MYIQPDTTITLYSGVDIGTDLQLAFSSRVKQTAYFNSKIKKQYVDCTVVKDKIGTIRIGIKPFGQAGTGEITGHDLSTCNYMSFINPNFDHKVIYCYIVDYRYLNNETAELMYMVDYWQTWCFDVSFQDMYIEREHVSAADKAKLAANPYDPTIPAMITQEPLPTPKGYEKVKYSIAWANDDDTKDGKVVMHKGTQDETTAMLTGSWDYWNAMLVLASTDWNKFMPEDNNGIAYKSGMDSICKHIKFVNTMPMVHYWHALADVPVGYDFYPNQWSDMTDAGLMHNVDETTGLHDDVTTLQVPAGEYVMDSDDRLWKNIASGTIQFNPTSPDPLYFSMLEVSYDWFHTSVVDELSGILERNHVKIFPAGSDTTLNPIKYLWGAEPHGCDVFILESQHAWQELSTFLAKYNAISQIVGLYGVPHNIYLSAIIDRDGSLMPILDHMDTDSTIQVSVSANRTSLTSEGQQKAVRNEKLLTSPFSYLRVLSPDGNIKEYQYENDWSVANAATLQSSDKMTFKLVADLTGDSPKLYLIPQNYKTDIEVKVSTVNAINQSTTPANTTGTAWANNMKFNLDEAICVGGFPQLSFNTDGYLSFLSSEYAKASSERTTETMNTLDAENYSTNLVRKMIPAIQGLTSSTAEGVIAGALGGGGYGAVLGGIAGLASGAFGAYDQFKTSGFSRKQYELQKTKYDEASEWSNGCLLSTDSPDIERFKNCKAAFANNFYTGGTGGVIRYLRGMGLFDFTLLHVQLRPEILDYYDAWFDMYGYASGRCGIPYVVQWCRSSSGDTYASSHVDPNWTPSNNPVVPETTYVKTYDAKVEYAMLPVAENIAQMFNTGIRFKKGDLN